MEDKKIKICFVTTVCSPDYLGGYSLYHKNLIQYIKSKYKNLDISWVYFGKKNKAYRKDNVTYVEIKIKKLLPFLFLKENVLLSKFFRKNYFDIINSIGGIWVLFYKKKKDQKIIHTFHGTAYYFYKNYFKKFGLIKRVVCSLLQIATWLQEIPHKKADKIICVSKKVKKQVEKLYGKRKNIQVIRTGVDLKYFPIRDKNKTRNKLKLDKKKIYGLYVGGGGYWTKGLDRTINLSEEIYKLNKKFRLILIGPDYEKVKHLLNKKFVLFLKNISRDDMPYYYNSAEVFFCLSRYEGGAPTMVVSEAMASGCLVVCAKSAEQEIIEDGKNGLIIENFDKKDAEEVLENLGNKKIIKNSISAIKEFSLEKWGEKTMRELLK